MRARSFRYPAVRAHLLTRIICRVQPRVREHGHRPPLRTILVARLAGAQRACGRVEPHQRAFAVLAIERAGLHAFSDRATVLVRCIDKWPRELWLIDARLPNLSTIDHHRISARLKRSHPPGATALAAVDGGQPHRGILGADVAVVGGPEHLPVLGRRDGALDAGDLAHPQVCLHAWQALAAEPVRLTDERTQVRHGGKQVSDELPRDVLAQAAPHDGVEHLLWEGLCVFAFALDQGVGVSGAV